MNDPTSRYVLNMSPSAAPSPPATTQNLTRDDLIALGRADKPYAFIPLASRVLATLQDDPGIRFLLAVNLSKLGLKTLSLKTLDRLPEAAHHDPDVLALTRAIHQLPDDQLDAATRIATADANLKALAPKQPQLDESFASWSALQSRCVWMRSTDGNLCVCDDLDDPDQITLALMQLRDMRTMAATFASTQLTTPTGPLNRPLTIEGLSPPWVFLAAHDALAPSKLGYTPPITIVQADPHEFFDGLAACDMTRQLSHPRIRLFIGSDAAIRWRDDMLERLDEVVLSPVVALPTLKTRISPPPQQIIEEVKTAQAREQEQLLDRINERYRHRDTRYWQERFDEALAHDKPLRFLIPISRYSTYIKHAAADLALALTELGMEATVITEPRDDAQLSPNAYLRIVDTFDPDAVIVINHFRGDVSLPLPDTLPWVCWIQDAMPHQFHPRTYQPLDCVIGHIHKELIHRAGFPIDRSLQFPLVASTRTFHPGPVSGAQRARYTTEVCFVSHQSETPEAFHRRCLGEIDDEAISHVIQTLRPAIDQACSDIVSTSMNGALHRATRHAIASCQRIDPASVDPSKISYLYRHYALPMADRTLRHEMLQWARRICDRHGWRLTLYGNGWENNPTLAPFAKGPIDHETDLRACYQCASVHLHASANTLVHQRVMECALSGGLPIARYTFDALSECTGMAKRQTLARCQPAQRHADGSLTFLTSQCPPLQEVARIWQQVGRTFPESVTLTAAQVDAFAENHSPGVSGLHAGWLYGDLGQLTFTDESSLESLLKRAITDRTWRAEQSSAMARRVMDACSTRAFAQRLITLITAAPCASQPSAVTENHLPADATSNR